MKHMTFIVGNSPLVDVLGSICEELMKDVTSSHLGVHLKIQLISAEQYITFFIPFMSTDFS